MCWLAARFFQRGLYTDSYLEKAFQLYTALTAVVTVFLLVADIEFITVFTSTPKTNWPVSTEVRSGGSASEALKYSSVQQLCKNSFDMTYGDSRWHVNLTIEDWREDMWPLSWIKTAHHLPEGKNLLARLYFAVAIVITARLKVSENELLRKWYVGIFSTFEMTVIVNLTAVPFMGDINELCIHQLPAQRMRTRARLSVSFHMGEPLNLAGINSTSWSALITRVCAFRKDVIPDLTLCSRQTYSAHEYCITRCTTASCEGWAP